MALIDIKNVNFRRFLTVAIGIVLVIAASQMKNLLASQKKDPDKSARVDKRPTIETVTVTNELISAPIRISGRIEALEKIMIAPEVAGIFKTSAKLFKEGSAFNKGDLLIAIDDSEAKLALVASRSAFIASLVTLLPDLKFDFPKAYPSWKAYSADADANQSLAALPTVDSDQLKFFLTAKEVYNRYYTIKSSEERLSKYRVYAPFRGSISKTFAEPGSMLSPGAAVAEFVKADEFEIKVALPSRRMNDVKIGAEVNLVSDELVGSWSGRVSRINQVVDNQTQTVSCFVALRSKELKDGIYLHGELAGSKKQLSFKILRDLIQSDNQVFVYSDGKLSARPIEVFQISGATAIVGGLKDGEKILSQSMPGAYDGMEVKLSEAETGSTKTQVDKDA